jgi:uncharacterized protein YjbJ (UPF0337 family)
MDKDRIEGKVDQAKGSVKETAGRVTGDRSTETSGQMDKAKGKVEEGVGETKDAIRGR